MSRDAQKELQAASEKAKQKSKEAAKQWAFYQKGVNKTLVSYGVGIEEKDRSEAWEVEFPIKAMVARDRFVFEYQKRVAAFDKRIDIDIEHRTGESKAWYVALTKRCSIVMDDIFRIEDAYLKDIEVVEVILKEQCGWTVSEDDVSAAHAPRLSQIREQAIERWNGAQGEL